MKHVLKQSCDSPLQRAWHVFRNTQFKAA